MGGFSDKIQTFNWHISCPAHQNDLCKTRGVFLVCFSDLTLDRSTCCETLSHTGGTIVLGREGDDHNKARDGVRVLMGGTSTCVCTVHTMANWYQLRSLRITGMVPQKMWEKKRSWRLRYGPLLNVKALIDCFCFKKQSLNAYILQFTVLLCMIKSSKWSWEQTLDFTVSSCKNTHSNQCQEQ